MADFVQPLEENRIALKTKEWETEWIDEEKISKMKDFKNMSCVIWQRYLPLLSYQRSHNLAGI